MKKVLLQTMFLVFGVAAFADTAPTTSPAPAPLVTQTSNEEKEILLADAIGKTLYVFDVDQGSNTSKCTGDCAEVWPPYILSDAEAATLQAPYTAIKRANGKLQLARDGRPLYNFAFDRKSGGDLGDGVGSVWHYIKLN